MQESPNPLPEPNRKKRRGRAFKSPEAEAKWREEQRQRALKRWEGERLRKEAELQEKVDEEAQRTVKKINVNLDYEMLDKQWELAKALERTDVRVVLFLGGIRGGKTYAGAREAIKQIYKYQRRPNLGWIISPTYPMSLVPEREFKAAAGDLIVRQLKGERAFLMMPPSSMPNHYYRVEVKSAEDPDRLRGPSLGFIWADEGAMMTKECFDILRGRVLDSKGVIFITTTPRGMNYCYEDIYLQSLKDPSYVVIQSKTTENTFLDRKEVEDLRGRYTGEFAQQELDAEFLSFKGLVYKDYRPQLHYVKPEAIPDNAYIVCGVDFGYNDPFVCLWLGKWDGVWHILDEHYESRQTLDYHIRTLQVHPLAKRVARYWGDPSAAQQRADMRAAGINIMPAIKMLDKNQKRWINAGIQEVTRWFAGRQGNGDALIKVFNKCVNVHTELSQYRYRDESDKNAGEVPIDAANHAMDALRYAIYSEARLSKDMSPRIQEEGENHKLDPRQELLNAVNYWQEKFDKAKKVSPAANLYPGWYTD